MIKKEKVSELEMMYFQATQRIIKGSNQSKEVTISLGYQNKKSINMRSFIITLTVLLLASVSQAFVQSTTPFVARDSATKVFAEGEKEKKEVVLDTNFDEVNIVRLLGMKRVKKMARKSKRKAEGN